MRLTSYTDYALRVLLYTGASGQTVTISQISTAFDISKEHLRKVVHALAQHGYISTTQGRNGGILLECFDAATNTCAIDGMCGLKHVLKRAQNSFLDTLGNYHLSDFLQNQQLVVFARG